jgi:uncharacterized damage-inducible protein DinB
MSRNNSDRVWLDAMHDTVASYRRMIEAAIEQLTDEELHRRPAAEFNSVAVLLRHLGGNLKSRWTDFLTTDGEKPDRDRDQEFANWEKDRASLMNYFDEGWQALEQAISDMRETDLTNQILIRGEAHTIPQALTRSMTHLSYHVGQLVMIARLVHNGEWKWMTIPPGGSKQHNQQTWGTSASRGLRGGDSCDNASERDRAGN